MQFAMVRMKWLRWQHDGTAQWYDVIHRHTSEPRITKSEREEEREGDEWEKVVAETNGGERDGVSIQPAQKPLPL